MKNALLITLLLTSFLTFAQRDLAKEFNVKKGVAIQGYDPVSYFLGEPQKGKENLTADYRGVTYWFASQQNLDAFKSKPEKYEPQYGGWCAYAMGDNGDKVKIDPETYKISDGKLYLFYNFGNTNTLPPWNENETSLKKKADKNWNKLIN